VLREGYDRLGEIGEQNWRATNATLLADALMRQGRDEDALEVLAVADEIAQRDDYDAQVRMRAVCARILARRGELAQAEQRAREAVEMVARTDDIVLHGDALLALAEALRASGATNAATAALRQALELFERKENVVQAEETRALLADVEVSV
jgi:tetratricopeptide (TPR) repeat protein